jgi:predicted nuclease of predicted toxin-antitoxin system
VRIIIDQQLPPLLAGWFRDQGLDAVHVRELGMSSAPDTDIWAEAARDDAVILSRDEDFVGLTRAGGARLVWIRVGNCSNTTLLAMIEANWPTILTRLEDGERLVELRS